MSGAPFPQALAVLAESLRCPHCGASLSPAERALTCARGHSYDLARQGYVALPLPRRRLPAGDSAAMVAAREEFLGAGHYAPIAEAVTAAAADASDAPPDDRRACVVDVGAGTGRYLAALLDAFPGAWGLALDPSRPALRRAARAHPRIAAVACDAWGGLPIEDGAADVVLNVFAPRDGAEVGRVLAPRGALIVVTPTPEHLHELVAQLGMLQVAAEKQDRLRTALSPHLIARRHHPVSFEMALGHADVRAAVAMGPSARHIEGHDLERRIRCLPERVTATASVVVATFEHR